MADERWSRYSTLNPPPRPHFRCKKSPHNPHTAPEANLHKHNQMCCTKGSNRHIQPCSVTMISAPVRPLARGTTPMESKHQHTADCVMTGGCWLRAKSHSQRGSRRLDNTPRGIICYCSSL